MKKIAILGVVSALAFPVLAQLPAAKQAELSAAGRASWTPGQERGQGAAFAVLDQARTGGITPENTDTMQMDDGNLTALPTVFGQVYGNRFSLGQGGVQLDTITLNSFSFYFMEDSVSDTSLFFQPADPNNATSINARASTNVTGLTNAGQSFSNPVLNVVPQSALGTTGVFNDTFFLGGWCLNSAVTFPINNETLGLATNGPRQQGYTAVSGTGPVAFAAQPFNAILRANVTSPNTVPVELMSFEVGN